jgi:hypothetical protein
LFPVSGFFRRHGCKYRAIFRWLAGFSGVKAVASTESSPIAAQFSRKKGAQ